MQQRPVYFSSTKMRKSKTRHNLSPWYQVHVSTPPIALTLLCCSISQPCKVWLRWVEPRLRLHSSRNLLCKIWPSWRHLEPAQIAKPDQIRWAVHDDERPNEQQAHQVLNNHVWGVHTAVGRPIRVLHTAFVQLLRNFRGLFSHQWHWDADISHVCQC